MDIIKNIDSLPATLYKYKDIGAYDVGNDSFVTNAFTLDLISKGHMWMAAPKTLNDPFDCAVPFSFDDPSGLLDEKWLKDFADRMLPQLPKQKRYAVAYETHQRNKRDPEYIEKTNRRFINIHNDRVGIFSLSVNNDNVTMWSHYASAHTGVCVGLEGEKLGRLQQQMKEGPLRRPPCFLELAKVQYEDNIPAINFY